MKKNVISHEGEIKLGEGGLSIPCYVLQDGTRILSGRGMQDALKLVSEGDRTSGQLSKFISQKSLSPFILKEETIGIDSIECYKGNQKINGYEATALVDICDGMLEARKHIKLTDRQNMVADQCEMLVRSFAKVGIIALVDEATGYQYDRERFELQKILNAYISDEIVKWQLTFTDDFYKQVYRLWGLPFIPKYIKNKPSFIGSLTTKYIYEQMPEGILDKIKEKTGKTLKGNWRYKWHQNLTPEIGREHLKKQIIEVTLLMEISKDKKTFEKLFKEKYNKDPQLKLFDEEDLEKVNLSDFNKNLKKGLDWNPKENKQ
ncbi:P63C domain-containing protein [Flavobacterium amniphilum]|uniref:P63C domain-containing protein n=1 Tax=Flavobacterium amniphilum TaxID=1834035 RepID=UPI00202A6A29|nr:P63C domain-containing protein [Flavobacterium amniphilum]MCL9807245.1 P63C domain-containing protein [Flavobacterium amniphilum]